MDWYNIFESHDLDIDTNEKGEFRFSLFKGYHFQDEKILSERELIDQIFVEEEE